MRSRSILVVEDDESIRQTLTELLKHEGYKVITATNGKEALELLAAAQHPYLIFLDLMMPVMDGWMFLEELKQTAHLQHIPVVVTSAVADRQKLPGVAEVLNKPYAIDKVLEIAKKYGRAA